MNYELAKLLEQTGWPQAGKGTWVVNPRVLVGRDRVYAPTLEELIAGCGEWLCELRQLQASQGWLASAATDMSASGHTPAEAVARLWLAIQQRRVGAASGDRV